MAMAQAFIDHKTPNLLHIQEEFLDWDGSAYKVLTTDDMEAELWLFLSTCRLRVPAPPNSNSGEPTIRPLVVKNGLATDVKKALKALVHHRNMKLTEEGWLDPEGKPDQRNLVAVQNGILNLSTRELMPASADLFVRSSLPFDYDANAPRPERWLQFLDEVWPDKDQQDCKVSLQEAMGYSLTPDTSLQKAFYLYGKTRSGKGTILNVLSNLVGPDNVTSPGVGDFSGSFCFQSFLGKKIAMLSDARLGWGKDSGPITENFLKIIGEDSVSINRKGKDFLNAKLNCKIWVGSNEILKVQDASGALAARFVFLPMRKTFLGKEDPLLAEKLAAELPGILNWAIEGWAKVQESRKITVPVSAAQEVDHMRSMAEPVHEFFTQHCELIEGHRATKISVFEKFKAWFLEDRNKEYNSGSGHFFRKFKEVAPEGAFSERKITVDESGTRQSGFEGLRCNFVPSFEGGPF